MGVQALPSWVYNGDEFGSGNGVAMPRNPRGVSGRCKVTKVEGATDLFLSIDGITFQMPRSLCEELNAALCTQLRPYAGLSLFERIMEQLDETIDRMMNGAEAEDGRDPGRAEAFCWTLAVIRNSYLPDFKQEKELAMARWRYVNGEGEEEG